MIAQLKQPNFGSVYKVKDSIVSYQKDAIPKLIELLKDASFVKLKNTADLTYVLHPTTYIDVHNGVPQELFEKVLKERDLKRKAGS